MICRRLRTCTTTTHLSEDKTEAVYEGLRENGLVFAARPLRPMELFVLDLEAVDAPINRKRLFLQFGLTQERPRPGRRNRTNYINYVATDKLNMQSSFFYNYYNNQTLDTNRFKSIEDQLEQGYLETYQGVVDADVFKTKPGTNPLLTRAGFMYAVEKDKVFVNVIVDGKYLGGFETDNEYEGKPMTFVYLLDDLYIRRVKVIRVLKSYSLQDTCRRAILRRNLPDCIENMPIPLTLKRFLECY